MPGDKHSGDPEQIDLVPGGDLSRNFVVADMREAARLVKKTRTDFFKLQGRIVDGRGNPAGGAYAVAWKSGNLSQFPDYFSAWSDDQGAYILYLPEGVHVLGAARRFPPEYGSIQKKEIVIEKDRAGLDLVIGPEPEK
jgi:hypothetical protein